MDPSERYKPRRTKSRSRVAWAVALLAVASLQEWEVAAQTPSASTPPDPPDPALPAVSTPREVELAERVRQLEAMVRDLSGRVEKLAAPPAAPPSNPTGSATGAGVAVPSGGRGGGDSAGAASTTRLGSTIGSQPDSPDSPPANMPASPLNLPGKVRFGPGFEISTEDTEYQLQFHNLTQFDGRFFQQGGETPLHDTFVVPRQWFIFSGRLTKPFEYYVSMAEGFDNLNILDVFLNIHYDDRIQLKLGRYKTPFTYEFFNGPINSLINPERSLFFNNFGLNRDLGIMLWGQLLDKRIDWAAGVFNGTRNGFVDSNDAKDFASYLNFRPFGNSGVEWLENFNIGGSVLAGREFNPPIPTILRTNVATTGNLTVGPEWLQFNTNVRESGVRSFWSLHAAWYYQQISLIAEWQSGFQDYAFVNSPTQRTSLPVDSFYVQGGYFLTGETVDSRGFIKPIRPFDLRRGKFGPGAFELAARYNPLDLGAVVFTNGLADPNNWANSLYTTDLGFNWYWNQAIKFAFTWQHAVFNQPVIFAPGRRQLTSDEFLFRFQIAF